MPNYGERYRAGEAISGAFVESAVNQVVSKRMVKQQQMRWTSRGASPGQRPRRRLPALVPAGGRSDTVTGHGSGRMTSHTFPTLVIEGPAVEGAGTFGGN